MSAEGRPSAWTTATFAILCPLSAVKIAAAKSNMAKALSIHPSRSYDEGYTRNQAKAILGL